MIHKEFLFISFFAIICCFLLIFFAKKFNLLDYPTKRKKHEFPTPYIGGLVLGIGCLIISKFHNPIEPQLQTLLLCSFLISIIGLIDDKFELNVVNKVILQSIPVLIVISKKLFISNLGTYEYFGLVSLGIFSVLITFLCVIFLMNAANYNDGINGNLISIFITFLFIIISLTYNSNDIIYKIIFLLIPINIILFFFNCIVKKELTLFLGDSGSLAIGFLISFICIYCAINNIIDYTLIPWTINYLVFEFISTNISRIIRKKKLFNAGDDHLHYLLKKILVKNYFVIIVINLIYIFNFVSGFIIFKFIGPATSIIFFVIYFFIYFYIREKLFVIFKL